MPAPSKQSAARKPTGQRRLFIKLSGFAVALLIGLALGEIAARWLQLAPKVQAIELHDPKSPYQRSENPILRYELRRGFTGQLAAQHQYLRLEADNFQQDGTSAVTGTVTINSYGFRDAERNREPPGSGRRIVLLGDSVVEMINYVSDESTISRLLENKFDDGTEILNMGTAGYCTRAEVELLKEKGLAFQPDVVVVMFVENDYWGYNLEHALGAAEIPRSSLINGLFVNSDLFRAASLRLNLFGFADEQNPAKWHRDAVGKNNVVSGFEVLQQLSEENDFEVIVAFWPSFLKDSIGYRYVLEGSNNLVAEPIAWHFGFPTTRLDAPYREHWSTLDPQPQPEWYYTCGDGMHPSVRGCEIAADALYGLLYPEPTPEVPQLTVTLPDDSPDRLETFQTATAVAAALALEPEQNVPLAQQVSATMLRQNRSVDAEDFLTAAEKKTPAELNEILASKTETSESYFAAAVQFLSTSQLFAARDMFERVAALEPDHVEARLYLFEILVEMNEESKAEEVLDEVLQLAPDNVEALAKQVEFNK